MKHIEEKGYAKINLYLDITSKYEDGYHQVNTVMQSVSLADEIRISLSDDGKIELSCDKEGLPCDGNNIAYRAAEIFLEKAKLSSGVKIEIVKRIPISAGLGGGSTDAAAVLRGLNELFERPLKKDELLTLGAELGADVPFCIECGTIIADKRGDRLSYATPLFNCYIVLANGGEGISTPFAYRQLDNRYNDFEKGAHRVHTSESLTDAIEKGNISSLGESLYNVFEKAILPIRPVACEIKELLLSSNAKGALMSGSGPTVFGIFDDIKLAENAVDKINKKGYFAAVCLPVGKIY